LRLNSEFRPQAPHPRASRCGTVRSGKCNTTDKALKNIYQIMKFSTGFLEFDQKAQSTAVPSPQFNFS